MAAGENAAGQGPNGGCSLLRGSHHATKYTGATVGMSTRPTCTLSIVESNPQTTAIDTGMTAIEPAARLHTRGR